MDFKLKYIITKNQTIIYFFLFVINVQRKHIGHCILLKGYLLLPRFEVKFKDISLLVGHRENKLL